MNYLTSAIFVATPSSFQLREVSSTSEKLVTNEKAVNRGSSTDQIIHLWLIYTKWCLMNHVGHCQDYGKKKHHCECSHCNLSPQTETLFNVDCEKRFQARL